MLRSLFVRVVVVLAVAAPIALVRTIPADAYGHVTYHGGMVEATSTTYAIFWLPNGAHFEPSGDDTRYESLIEQYFKDVGGTPYYKTLKQYSRNSHRQLVRGGPILNSSTFGGAYVDTTPYPHAGTQNDPLLGADIRAEVSRAMQVNKWTAGVDHQFFVYTSASAQVCDLPLTLIRLHLTQRPCTFDSDTTIQACGDRAYFMQDGQPVLYTMVPGAATSCLIDPNRSPNGDPRADTAVLLSSAYQFDAVVDPVGTGWFHSNPLIGSISNCTDLPNVTLRGHTYILTTLWSNAQNRCVVRNPPPRSQPDISGRVVYEGGSIMPTTTTYPIFWLPAGIHFESNEPDARYEGLMTRFFKDVGGTPYYNILTQYSADAHGHPVKNGPIQNNSNLGATYLDTAPYPHAGSTKDPLLSSDIEAEVTRAMQVNHWTPGLNKLYVVFLGAGINLCQGTPSMGACTFTTGRFFCAYHSYLWQDEQPVIYTVQPDGYSLKLCRQMGVADPSPNHDVAADTNLSAVSHELFESVSDPLRFGWRDGNDLTEIGDKCDSNFGVFGTDGGNVTLHGDRYLLQSEWSNADRSCVLRFNPGRHAH